MDTLTHWPIDVSELKMGDYIDCTKIIATSPTERKFQIALLKIKGAIEKQIRQADLILYLRQRGNGLYVMTDADLSEYERTHGYRAARRMRRSVGRLSEVNREALTDGQLKKHDAHMGRLGRMVAAQTEARKLPALAPVKSGFQTLKRSA